MLQLNLKHSWQRLQKDAQHTGRREAVSVLEREKVLLLNRENKEVKTQHIGVNTGLQ